MKLPSRLTNLRFRRSVRTIAEPPWLQLVVEDHTLTSGPGSQQALILGADGELVGRLPVTSATYEVTPNRLGVLTVKTNAVAVIEGVKL